MGRVDNFQTCPKRGQPGMGRRNSCQANNCVQPHRRVPLLCMQNRRSSGAAGRCFISAAIKLCRLLSDCRRNKTHFHGNQINRISLSVPGLWPGVRAGQKAMLFSIAFWCLLIGQAKYSIYLEGRVIIYVAAANEY